MLFLYRRKTVAHVIERLLPGYRRITSYNVCYTKLLRMSPGTTVRPPRSMTRAPAPTEDTPSPIDANTPLLAYGTKEQIEKVVKEYCQKLAPGGGYVLGSSVITSYSIHYTKLYEGDIENECRLGWNESFDRLAEEVEMSEVSHAA